MMFVYNFLIVIVWIAAVFAQPPRPSSSEMEDDIEKRYTPELREQLESAQQEALLLYTEFAARSAGDLKAFLRTITTIGKETLLGIDTNQTNQAPAACKETLEKNVRKVRWNAHVAADYSAENHHKFILGHMIVFRMHLNKSEDYLKKCDKIVKTCGIACETNPRIVRWRRLAADEIHRVREDMLHARKVYRDLIVHQRRRFNNLRRTAGTNICKTVEDYQTCIA